MIRVCERHGGNVIPPGEDLCVACQREQEEREHPPPCQHRRILYVCVDCGELEPRSPGYLYPVLTDQDGRILDGRARLAAGRPGPGQDPGGLSSSMRPGAYWLVEVPCRREEARESLTAEIASCHLPVRRPASQKVCTRHGIWVTDSYHPQLACAEGAPT